MDTRAGGPTEPEETDWNGKGACECGWQTLFRRYVAVLVELRLDIFVKVVEKGRAGSILIS